MDTRFTRKEKELRKVDKKVRNLKAKNSWDMEKIGELEEKSGELSKAIIQKQKKKEENASWDFSRDYARLV